MKKQAKKLKLARETMWDLEGRDMPRVVGGAYTDFACYPGDYSYYCASVRVVCKYPPTI